MEPHKWKKEITAWANGEKIQAKGSFDKDWFDCVTPLWIGCYEFRIKPEECKLQKEKEHWEKGGDLQYYCPLQNCWFELKNNPDFSPDWNNDTKLRIIPTPKIEYIFNGEVKDDINSILDYFDFQRVLKVMTALDWTWWFTDGVPEIWDVRKEARQRLEEAVKGLIHSGEKRWFSACGGFLAEAEIEEGNPKIYLKLSFVVSEWDNYETD